MDTHGPALTPAASVLVQFDTVEEYPFELLDPGLLERDEQQSHRFTASHLPEWSFPILRFHKAGTPFAVFVGFVIESTTGSGAEMPEADEVNSVIMAISASTPDSQVIRNMLSANEVSVSTGASVARGPRSGCGDTCGHNRVYVTVTAVSVFNQRVITITLSRSEGGIPVERKATLCLLKKEVWFAEEASKQLDKPRKKGLFGRVK